MKLRKQILLLVMVPLIVLACVTYLIGTKEITWVMKDTIRQGLEASAVAVRDSLSAGNDGDYYLDDAGEMWKGEDLNISQSGWIADNVKKNTGMEITVFYQDTRYMTSVVNDQGERVLGTKAADSVVNTVLKKGEDFFVEKVDVAGEAFFAFYTPLYNSSSKEPIGMIFTGISQENAEASIDRIIHTLLIIICCVVLICAVAAWLLATRMVNGVKYSVKILGKVAEGDLTGQTKEKYLRRRSEVGDMVKAIDKLKNELILLIGKITDESLQVFQESQSLSEKAENTSLMVTQVDKSMTEIAEGSGVQADETQDASENVVQIGNMVESTSTEVKSMHDNSAQMKEAGDSAAQILKELNTINIKASKAIEDIYHQTHTTNESAQKIREATNFITSIAEETNLLSLNASIEAARAGDEGRGFAVVASQIQTLAEQSNESAKLIGEIVGRLIQDSEKAVKTMDEVQKIMDIQNEKLKRTGESFETVQNGIGLSMESVVKIADQTSQLDSARVKVVDGVQNLSAVAEENAASIEEISTSVAQVALNIGDITNSAGELRKIADELKESIETFQL